jgi:hypothetical protein
METRPGDPKHGDLRGGETLPRDERLGSFADGEETEPQDERPGLVRRGIGGQAARRVPGDRRHGHRRRARA